jgi:hypothetical protein
MEPGSIKKGNETIMDLIWIKIWAYLYRKKEDYSVGIGGHVQNKLVSP